MSCTPDRLALIVEHDAWLRWMLRAWFENAGFEVVCASNGFGGLRRAVELRPRLIVLGAALPELSTAELANQLRAVHHFGRTQIVNAEDVLSGGWPELPAEPSVAEAATYSERGVGLLGSETKTSAGQVERRGVAPSNTIVAAAP
jgi:CheY-like chemotaxis protein